MPANPTPAELRAALTRIRALPLCAGWPDDVDAVLADPLRGTLLRLNAAHAPAPHTARKHSAAPAALDFKRRAAGERDD